MAKSELPRERLIQQGEKSLSNSELLAILINTGRQGYSSIDIANDIMNQYGSLKELKHLSIDDLIKNKGIGLHKAVTLKAAFELGERMNARCTLEKVKIKSPTRCGRYDDVKNERFNSRTLCSIIFKF